MQEASFLLLTDLARVHALRGPWLRPRCLNHLRQTVQQSLRYAFKRHGAYVPPHQKTGGDSLLPRKQRRPISPRPTPEYTWGAGDTQVLGESFFSGIGGSDGFEPLGVPCVPELTSDPNSGKCGGELPSSVFGVHMFPPVSARIARDRGKTAGPKRRRRRLRRQSRLFDLLVFPFWSTLAKVPKGEAFISIVHRASKEYLTWFFQAFRDHASWYRVYHRWDVWFPTDC